MIQANSEFPNASFDQRFWVGLERSINSAAPCRFPRAEPRSGTTCAVSPTQGTLGGSGSAKATVTVTVPSTASSGTKTLTSTRADGNLSDAESHQQLTQARLCPMAHPHQAARIQPTPRMLPSLAMVARLDSRSVVRHYFLDHLADDMARQDMAFLNSRSLFGRNAKSAIRNIFEQSSR